MTHYTIQDFSDRCGISVHRLRHYEKLGLIAPERDPQNKYRFFTDRQLLDVQRIGALQCIGVPLAEMRSEDHAYAPPLYRRQVQDKILSLREQIEELDTQLKMLMDIEMRMPEMATGSCREWYSLPYYVLYYDDCKDPSLMANWMGLMPYVLSFFSVPAEQLNDPGRCVFDAKPGLGIIEKHLYSLPLRIEPPVKHIEAFRGVRCIVQLRDPLHPQREELRQIFDHLEKSNLRVSGDMLLGVRGSDTDENGEYFFTRVLLKVETV